MILKKFSYALKGLKECLKQSTFLFMVVIAISVIFLGIQFNISYIEWAIITLCIIACLGSEAINTSIEKACDIFSSGWILSEIGIIKDIAAGAVFIFSIGSAIIGLLIFIPKF